MEISQEASTSTENIANEVMDFENVSLANENPPMEQSDINRALVRAIRKRNDRKVRKLIGKGAAVNHILEGTNRTPLKLAMQLYETPTVNGRQIIKALIKAGADANTKIELGFTVLHIAAKTKDLSLAKRVLDCGAKLDILSDSGKTALRNAIESNPNMSSIPFVAFLLDSGANVNLPNSDGETVIHCIHEAPQLESAQILDMLIHHGIDLNAQCPTGHTPLHYAVIQNSRHTIRLLLNTGACDQTIKSLASETALHLAVGNNYIRSARILLNVGSDVNEPIDCFEKFTVRHVAAARGGSEKIVEAILEVNHNINEQADDGNTPLPLAVYQQNGKIVKLLLNYNVDLERKNKNGQTPLHMSAYSATPFITKLLIYKSADATTRCNNNRSILQAAFYGDNTDVFRLLLAPCCAPNFEE